MVYLGIRKTLPLIYCFTNIMLLIQNIIPRETFIKINVLVIATRLLRRLISFFTRFLHCMTPSSLRVFFFAPRCAHAIVRKYDFG